MQKSTCTGIQAHRHIGTQAHRHIGTQTHTDTHTPQSTDTSTSASCRDRLWCHRSNIGTGPPTHIRTRSHFYSTRRIILLHKNNNTFHSIIQNDGRTQRSTNHVRAYEWSHIILTTTAAITRWHYNTSIHHWNGGCRICWLFNVSLQ